MKSNQLTAMLESLPGNAAMDPVTGRITFASGTVICYHVDQTSTVRDFRPGWYRRRDGARWRLRQRRRPTRVITTTCPNCPIPPYHALVDPADVFAVQMAPYVYQQGEATW